MCTTTTHYETHISTECSTGGTAQCDGFCGEHNNECTCHCHTANDLPETIQGVRDWHDEFESIVASFDSNPLDIGLVWEQAKAEADKRSTDGKQFKVLLGQGRVVVAERYS